MRMRVVRWPGEESKVDPEVKRRILIVKTPLNPGFEALVQKCDSKNLQLRRDRKVLLTSEAQDNKGFLLS